MAFLPAASGQPVKSMGPLQIVDVKNAIVTISNAINHTEQKDVHTLRQCLLDLLCESETVGYHRAAISVMLRNETD